VTRKQSTHFSFAAKISLRKLKLLCCNLCRARCNRSKFKPFFPILSATFYIVFCSVYVGEGRNRSTEIVVATKLSFGRSGPGIPIGTRDFLVSKRSRPSLKSLSPSGYCGFLSWSKATEA